MTDPTLEMIKAAVALIRAKLTAEGYTQVNSRVVMDPQDAAEFPYLVIGGNTGVNFPTKTTEGMTCTLTLVAWSDDPVECLTIARDGLAALTDRDNKLEATGFTTGPVNLDFRSDLIREENPPEVYWGQPFRVRFTFVEA